MSFCLPRKGDDVSTYKFKLEQQAVRMQSDGSPAESAGGQYLASWRRQALLEWQEWVRRWPVHTPVQGSLSISYQQVGKLQHSMTPALVPLQKLRAYRIVLTEITQSKHLGSCMSCSVVPRTMRATQHTPDVYPLMNKPMNFIFSSLLPRSSPAWWMTAAWLLYSSVTAHVPRHSFASGRVQSQLGPVIWESEVV